MKTYNGIVVSDKMDKTIVVEVARNWVHPVYKKTVKRTKKYPVHDAKNEAKVGDKVAFIESRPYSKSVHFSLSEITEKASAVAQALVLEEVTKDDSKKA